MMERAGISQPLGIKYNRSRNSMLQRACGQHTGSGGECAECKKKRLGLQRQAANESGPAVAPPIVHEVLRSPGQPLDAATRASMEPRFGHNFSQVRVHTDAKAAQSARAVDALAYTVGLSIVFASNQYAPNSHAGTYLLAHELAHTVQNRSSNTDDDLMISSPTSDTEVQAENSARSVMRGQFARINPVTVRNILSRYSRADALREATTLETRYPGWRFVLPNCPCTDAEARADTATWTGPGECMPSYHPGAVTGYRTKRGYPSSVAGTSHGQQCCYDGNGMLITYGPGAGTPDVWAPIGLNVVRHYLTDVRPFDELGWSIYNQYWIPNNGNLCGAGDFPATLPPERIV